jgi:hypothetical protein
MESDLTVPVYLHPFVFFPVMYLSLYPKLRINVIPALDLCTRCVEF